jgi:DNA invertase Pin-like site-specific DNA recombinase
VAGQRIGCTRVRILDENAQRQLDGEILDGTFSDKASGRDSDRPPPAELLRFTRDRDTAVVHNMYLDDLRTLVQTLTNKGVRVEFVKKHLVFSAEGSPWPT